MASGATHTPSTRRQGTPHDTLPRVVERDLFICGDGSLRDDGDASGDGASGDGASGDISVPSVGDLWHSTLNGAFAFVVGCTFFWCVVQPIIVHCRRQSRGGFDGGGPLL